MQFIEVTDVTNGMDDKTVMIGLRYIDRINMDASGAAVLWLGETCIRCKESYEEVRSALLTGRL